MFVIIMPVISEEKCRRASLNLYIYNDEQQRIPSGETLEKCQMCLFSSRDVFKLSSPSTLTPKGNSHADFPQTLTCSTLPFPFSPLMAF